MTDSAPPYTPASPPPPPPPAQAPPYGPPYPYGPVRHRPIGVTILAILEILFGILMLLAAFGLFVVAGLFASSTFMNQINQSLPQWLLNIAPVAFAVAGIIVLIIAIIAFMLAYGFLKGRGWAWTLAMVLLFLSIIFDIISWALSGFNPASIVSTIISIIIAVVIIIYLMRPNVKAWFGKM